MTHLVRRVAMEVKLTQRPVTRLNPIQGMRRVHSCVEDTRDIPPHIRRPKSPPFGYHEFVLFFDHAHGENSIKSFLDCRRLQFPEGARYSGDGDVL